MKKIKILSLLAFIIVFTSCLNRTDGDEDTDVAAEGSLTAKVDGVDYASLKTTVSAVFNNGVAAIQGSNSEGDYIRINIINYTGIGSYKTGDLIANPNSVTYGKVAGNAAWVSTFNFGDGTIEVTGDNDTTITGTFTFTGINSSDNNSTKTLTEGKFSAPKN
jgi:hypothetical protein